MQPRYRFEGQKACIDLRVQRPAQLFDGRDPAPFRERDLDDDAVEYIVGAAEEIGHKHPLKIVVWVAEPSSDLPPAMIRDAVKAHFDYELDRLGRHGKQHLRQAQLSMLVGLTILTLFLTLAELTKMLAEGHLRQILREGLVIFGWVAMWRPLELVLYDWWPLVVRRRLLRRIRDAELLVTNGAKFPS